MQTPALNFIVIYVSDMDAAYNYFVNVLGFAPASEHDQTSPSFRQMKNNGGVDFGLIVPDEVDEGKPGDIDLYFYADDVQAMREAIISKGVAAGPVTERPFGPVVAVPAPDGLRVMAWQPRQ